MPHFPKPYFRKGRALWYVQIDGRQINLGPNRDDAFDRYHQLMANPRQRRVASGSLAAIIDAFLEWVEKNRSPDTYEWYRYRLQRFIEQHPDLRASELRPYHVETWASGYDFSVTSKRNYLRSIKRCMKWAKRQGYIDQNPIEDLEVPVAAHREVAISQSQFAQFVALIWNDVFADLVSVTWESGCRPQESLRVESRHVDLENRRWVFPRAESKMKRTARVVYLTDVALEITRRWMLVYPEGPIFRNGQGKPWAKDAVNCAFLAVQMRMGKAEMKHRGEEISADAIAGLIPTLSPTRTRDGAVVPKTAAELRSEAKRKLTFKRAAQLAPKYSLYALRHSWATNALQNGVDALTVAILMGHEDPSTLAKVYQHLSLNPQPAFAGAGKTGGRLIRTGMGFLVGRLRSWPGSPCLPQTKRLVLAAFRASSASNVGGTVLAWLLGVRFDCLPDTPEGQSGILESRRVPCRFYELRSYRCPPIGRRETD
jgi:integrase